MADEGLHEIQLKGKQLVFLFMASTVLAVVIFLCGVMVGRGVPLRRAGQTIEATADAAADPTVDTDTQPVSTAASTPTLGGPSDPSREPLDYPRVLTSRDQEPPEIVREPLPAVDVRPTATPGAPAAANVVAAKPAANVPIQPVAPSSIVGTEPAGRGYVVQVAAVKDRREAETIARRLSGKGYPSFVTTPGAGTPRMFRVRVGKYPDRRAAETVAKRLEREEQFKPWITR